MIAPSSISNWFPLYRVRTLFWTKTSRTFQGLSRTPFSSEKSLESVFFSSITAWAILSWRSFILGTWEAGLDKVSTEIQGLSSTDWNFQGLSRPWTFYFKFQGLSRCVRTLIILKSMNLVSLTSWKKKKPLCCGEVWSAFVAFWVLRPISLPSIVSDPSHRPKPTSFPPPRGSSTWRALDGWIRRCWWRFKSLRYTAFRYRLHLYFHSRSNTISWK